MDFTNAEQKISDKISGTGYSFSGWQVTSTTEAASNADVNAVDSAMEVHAVANWTNAELPVNVSVKSANLRYNEDQGSTEVTVNLGLSHNRSEDLSCYIIIALKARDEEKCVDQTVYADRRIEYLDEGNDINNEKEVSFKIRTDERVNSVEAVAVE